MATKQTPQAPTQAPAQAPKATSTTPTSTLITKNARHLKKILDERAEKAYSIRHMPMWLHKMLNAIAYHTEQQKESIVVQALTIGCNEIIRKQQIPLS